MLKNEKKKCVYIFYSKNLITSLSRNVREMKDKVHVYKPLNSDIRNWKFDIIETLSKNDTFLDISCKMQYHKELYKQLGYEVKTTRIMEVRFRVDIGDDYKIYCKLITKGYKQHIVGIFNNMEEANDFIQLYKQMKIITPIYANNELTCNYMRNKS